MATDLAPLEKGSPLRPCGNNFDAGHLVARERPGLVRTDDRGAPERLHRWELPNDGLLLRHFPRTEGEAGGDHCRKPLRNRRDCEGDCNLEVVRALVKVELDPQRASRSQQIQAEGRLVGGDRQRLPFPSDAKGQEMLVVDRPDDQADHSNDFAERVTKVIQFPLQGRVLLLVLGIDDELVRLSDLCILPRSRGDHDAAAVRHRSSREEHVHLALDVQVPAPLVTGQGLGDLLHRDGLPSEGGLVKPDRLSREHDHSPVRRHLVPRAELDDIPGHELLGGKVAHPAAVPQALAGRVVQLLQGLQGLLRVRLLPHADDRVQEKDEDDDPRLHEGFQGVHREQAPNVRVRVDLLYRLQLLTYREDEAHDSGNQENLDERVIELLQNQLPDRC
mmetsp:Transcript_613/g.1782  ORF Transcript_613/g.1782 Transcript_613/m.1782 type:complete len:390 (+) Transcript_613:4206-5375(+)